MDLRISQTHARIGVERSPGRLEIQTRRAMLEFKQKHAKVNIKTEKPRVLIDQYACFAEAGLKNFRDLTRDMVQRAYQSVMEYTGKVAADGDTLAAIERGGNPIADIAERDAYPQHEFGLDTIPRSRPKFTVEGSVKIEADNNAGGVNNGVEGNFIPGRININFSPSQVRIYMQQYNSVDIQYVGNRLNTYA